LRIKKKVKSRLEINLLRTRSDVPMEATDADSAIGAVSFEGCLPEQLLFCIISFGAGGRSGDTVIDGR
jgi:hypothetical protein